MTATPGTIPALPQYQPNALPLAGTEALEIVNNTNATAAASYLILLTDLVGKAPGVMSGGTGTTSDLMYFLRPSTGSYYSVPIGSLGLTFGNLPTGGATGTFLTKNSGANYDASWTAILGVVPSGGTAGFVLTKNTSASYDYSWAAAPALPIAGNTGQILDKLSGADYSAQWVDISTLVRVGTALATGGTSTSPIIFVPNGAITSAQLATSAIDFNATALLTGILGMTWGGIGTSVISTVAVVVGNTATALKGLVGATGQLLQYSNSTTLAFGGVNLAATASITGILPLLNGGLGTNVLGTNTILVGNGSGALQAIATAAAGFVLGGQGNAAPAFVNITTLAVTQFTVAGGLSVSQNGTGGSITGTGTIYTQHTPTIRAASYTIATTDLGATLVFSTTTLMTATLGTVTATQFGPGWYVDIINVGSSTSVMVTMLGAANWHGGGVVPAVTATTMQLSPYMSIRAVSDGSNWVPMSVGGAANLNMAVKNQTFAGGVRMTPFNAGTTSGGTVITFDSGNGPIQYVRNVGTGTFSAMAIDGEIDCLVMGSTGAGTITFSGFNASASAPTGDTVAWNATALFLLSMRRVNGSSTYRWAAYQ